MNGFGEKVRGYRKDWGITQKALAEAAGLTPTYYNRMEKGNRKIPKVETVLALVAALHRVVRFTLEQAEELFELAGYSPQVVQRDGRFLPPAAALPTMAKANPAVGISDSLGVTGEMVEYLIASAHLSEEEEKHIAAEVIEFTKRLLALRETLRKREDG